MTATLTIVPDPGLPVDVAGLTLPPLHAKWTREGECRFREARLHIGNDAAFRAAWKKHKRQWLERGFSLRSMNGAWYLQQWLRVDGDRLTLTGIGQDKLDALTAQQAEMELEEVKAPALVYQSLPEELEKILWDYQIQPARQLYRALTNGAAEWGYPGAADLSDMGTGKTAMSIAAALATGRRIVVLCPSVGQEGWRKMFALFGAEPHFIGTYEAVRGAWRPNVATEDAMGKFTWVNAHEITLILDEAQAVRHDDTLTVRCCSAAIRQGIPIIVASATIATSPLEMRFAGRITGLHQGGDDWTRFLQQHGCHKKGQTWKWDQRQFHLDRIHRRLFPARGCRVRKQDLGERCPETRIEVLPFDVPEGRQIEQEWQATLEMIERIERQGGTLAAKMAESRARMKMWQRCEMVLVPYVGAKVKQDIRDGRSVALFMNFNESRIAMSRLLNTNAGFYGGQPKARRKYFEEQFQADREFVLVSNIGAGGASVSLHDVRGERPRTAYIFPTDHVVQMEQATGRVDRVGGKSLSLQFIPCLKGAITEKMVHRTRQKMIRIATINNGMQNAESRF